jgi:hypothetical protein
MFNSNEEVFAFARRLRAELFMVEREELANRIGSVVDNYWTSATEAFGTLLNVLKEVRQDAGNELPEETINEIETAIAEIGAVIDQANRGR